MNSEAMVATHDGQGIVYLVEPLANPVRTYRLLTAEELAGLPPQPYRVKHVLPMEGIAAIFGPSGSGKSFLGFDMAGAIAGRGDWFGYRVKNGPVVYLVLEGEGGLRNRIAAYRTACGGDSMAGVRFIAAPFDLLTADLDALILSIRAENLDRPTVFVDTLNRAAPNADENTSKDMGGIITACKKMQTETGGLVVLIHHAGKDTAKGMRGHSSLFASLDSVIQVSRDDKVPDFREWRLAKAKDGRDGEAHGFSLRVIDLGEDEDGDRVTSCSVEPLHSDPCQAHRPNRKRLSARDDAILTALHRATDAHGEPPTAEIQARFGGFTGPGESRKVCHIDHWRAEAYLALSVESEDGGKQHAQKVAFQRAREGLQKAGYVATLQDLWWAIFDDEPPPAQGGTNRHTVPPCADTKRHGTAHTPVRGVPGVPVVTGFPDGWTDTDPVVPVVPSEAESWEDF